jgi:hypothetical protein
MSWADSFLHTLKENDVRLVIYVPDNVLTPLIAGAAADNYSPAHPPSLHAGARHRTGERAGRLRPIVSGSEAFNARSAQIRLRGYRR